MSEDKADEPQQGEGHLQEIDEGRVISNLRLLTLKFVEEGPPEEIDRDTKSKLLSIKEKGVIFTDNGPEAAITIEYDTRTGEIGSPDHKKFLGDSSILRTFLIERDGKKTILLHRPGNMPSASQYATAITGEQMGPELGNRRILPERLSPEHPDLIGVEEVWGESEFVESARGDLVMLQTIRRFNELYGPPR